MALAVKSDWGMLFVCQSRACFKLFLFDMENTKDIEHLDGTFDCELLRFTARWMSGERLRNRMRLETAQ